MLSALYHDIILEFLKNKKLAAVFVMYFIAVSFLFVQITHAFFTSSASSVSNTFAAAAEFPNQPPLTAPVGSIVINEINWEGSNGDGLDEWVELKNTTSNPINVNGWVIENLGVGGPGANITISSSSAVVPPSGFFLISAFDKGGSKINVDPDYINSSISLVNGGEQLVLRASASGTIIDTANDTGDWFEGSGSTPKKTMERKTPPGDGTQAANWQTATTHTNMDSSGSTDEFGTPKATNGL